jgi:serine/threonine protein kinase
MKIFKGRGTPSLEFWPTMKDLPLYKPDYPQYQPALLSKLVPTLDELGLDLLDKMLRCNPAERITAKDAMLHPYLKDVPDYVKNMK